MKVRANQIIKESVDENKLSKVILSQLNNKQKNSNDLTDLIMSNPGKQI